MSMICSVALRLIDEAVYHESVCTSDNNAPLTVAGKQRGKEESANVLLHILKAYAVISFPQLGSIS